MLSDSIKHQFGKSDCYVFWVVWHSDDAKPQVKYVSLFFQTFSNSFSYIYTHTHIHNNFNNIFHRKLYI